MQEDAIWSRQIAVTIGGRIRSLREERGWNRSDLAEQVGAAYSTVALWEDGSHPPKLEALLLLMGVFNLHSLEELVKGPFGTASLLAMRKKQ